MKLDRRFKEAFKVALALALAYGIALKLAWLNPSWAGFGVAMIAMQTAGQSIHKGLDRLAGTIPACIAALTILALAPQERWLFMVYSAVWVFFTTYMMIRSKNHTYFWNVAGFACLVILLTGPDSAANDFQHAVFRTLETALGIGVYTLVTVFLWPVNNAGAIKKSINNLAVTFENRNQVIWQVISGKAGSDKLENFHQKSIQQLNQFSQALTAEGSENYEVREIRPALEQVHQLATSLMESQDRLETSLEEISRLDLNTLFPHLEKFFTALESKTGKPSEKPRLADLSADRGELNQLSGLDRAAALIFEKELSKLGSLFAELRVRIQNIQANAANTVLEGSKNKYHRETSAWLPVIDRDCLMGALFPALCLVAAFLIWITFNPPGHSGWVQLPATFAMAVGATQQIRMTAFLKPFAVMMSLALAVYVLVLPQLSSFAGLGLTLFLCAFVARYFFSGLAQLAGMVSIVLIISIQNQQSYNFAAQANTLVYVLLCFVLVYAMSYMLGSSRPEKVVLKMTMRFFRSAQFITSQIIRQADDEPNWIEQWKLAYYRNEMSTLPTKIEAWGKSIDPKLFPNTSQEHIGQLVTSLRSLVYRFEEMLLMTQSKQAGNSRFIADLRKWAVELEHSYERWSKQPDANENTQREQYIKARLPAFERRTEEFLMRLGDETSQETLESLYRLLGGLRGLSQATLSFQRVQHEVDWNQWREERFS